MQKRLFGQTKFDTLMRYRCGNLFYVVAEDGIFQPHEIPLGWGLLVRRADRLELREKPVWQDLDDHERLALLHKIAASGNAQRSIGKRAFPSSKSGKHAGWAGKAATIAAQTIFAARTCPHCTRRRQPSGRPVATDGVV